jgi:hypothetical protein
MFVGQAVQILVLSLAIGVFFVVFGALAVGPDVREAWEVQDRGVLLRLTLFEEPLQVTEALLTGEMADSFKARAEYLELRRA